MDYTALFSGDIQKVMALIIVLLVGAVLYLYKDNRRQYEARLDDQKQSETKIIALLDEYRKQQDLWFEKLQLAGKK